MKYPEPLNPVTGEVSIVQIMINIRNGQTTYPENMGHVDSNTPKPEWPRIRELPDAEREPFSKFLTGQTLPLMEGVPMSEQDAYYPWDYENWKRNPKNRFFD